MRTTPVTEDELVRVVMEGGSRSGENRGGNTMIKRENPKDGLVVGGRRWHELQSLGY